MNVVKIDRTSNSHGDYYGVVQLTYDEIVMICNALYQKKKNSNSEVDKSRYSILYNNWNDFKDMTCYGRIVEL